MLRALIIAACVFASGLIRAEVVTLPVLEASLDDSPEVEIAAAELEESLYLLQRERERRGLKVFASAGYADVTEPVTDELKRSYRRTTATVGLTYPLFGTRAREQALVAEAKSNVYEREQQAHLTRARARAALRRSYVDYWAAMRRTEISMLFLQHEPEARDWLARRTASGHLLEADRLEFLTAFDLTRRALATDHEITDRSFRVLAMLTNDALQPFEPVAPELPDACMDPARLRAAVLAEHPELNILRSRMDSRIARVDVDDNIEASLNFTATVSEDHPSALSGDGLGLSFNVRMPFDLMGSRRASRGARAAAALGAQRQLELRSAQIANEADAVVRRYRIAIENLSFAETRLAAALESVRERQLRAANLPGDVLEQLQQARFANYRTALDLSDAEAQILKAKIDILALSDAQCDTERRPVEPKPLAEDETLQSVDVRPTVTAPAAVAKATEAPANEEDAVAARRGVYLWKSAPFLDDPNARAKLWGELESKGLTRVLLSLDGEQLKNLERGAARRTLRSFIADSENQGVEVELLLGEPTWMLDEHRHEMLDVIGLLDEFNFAGLHLDLEPGMIDTRDHPRVEVLSELAHTVIATIEASPWPVSMSLHFRDLAPTDGYCLGCVLSDVNLREIALMIYVSNPDRVAEIATDVAQQFPRLTFAVAQSVEPHLAPEETHASRGGKELERRLDRLVAMLDPDQFGSILIQSWNDLENLQP